MRTIPHTHSTSLPSPSLASVQDNPTFNPLPPLSLRYDDTSLLPDSDDQASRDELLTALDNAPAPIKKGHRKKLEGALKAGCW